MYLTKINHDFNFTLEEKVDEVLHTLVFKRMFFSIVPTFLQSKTTFHTNQGRESYLAWHIPFFQKKKRYVFVVENIVKFYWEEGSRSIRYRYLKNADDSLVKYWLLHTFLPLYYVLEEIYEVLHVGAIAADDKALLFAAPSFGGKSTLTSYFLQQGHALLSDDRVGIVKKDEDFYAVASYPYVRNYREMEDLGEPVADFAKKALPVNVLFYLKQVGSQEKVQVKKVKGYKRFSVLEMSHDIKLSSLKQRKFFTLQHLAQNLTIYELSVPQNLDRLDEVYGTVLKVAKGHF